MLPTPSTVVGVPRLISRQLSTVPFGIPGDYNLVIISLQSICGFLRRRYDGGGEVYLHQVAKMEPKLLPEMVVCTPFRPPESGNPVVHTDPLQVMHFEMTYTT